jgi:hypothetical protein
VAPPSGDDLWCGPDDQWPRHQHPSIRDAIDVARAAGWHLRRTRGHGYGRAFCRRAERGGAVCKIIIDTTPKGPENRANDLRRAVRDCPHHFADQTSDLSYASALLDGADALLEAAEALLDAEAASNDATDAWQKAQDLLDVAESNADEADRVMEIAQKFEDEARRLTQSGWLRGLEASGVEGPPSAYVIGAEERATEASGVVAGAANQEDPTLIGLKGRVGVTKGRIADVRLRLGHGGP